jgi:hypothetical protein
MEQRDKMERVKRQIDDVKDVMMKNIDSILPRGEAIESLMPQSENLLASSMQFKKSASSLRRQSSIFGAATRAIGSVVERGGDALASAAQLGGELIEEMKNVRIGADLIKSRRKVRSDFNRHTNAVSFESEVKRYSSYGTHSLSSSPSLLPSDTSIASAPAGAGGGAVVFCVLLIILGLLIGLVTLIIMHFPPLSFFVNIFRFFVPLFYAFLSIALPLLVFSHPVTLTHSFLIISHLSLCFLCVFSQPTRIYNSRFTAHSAAQPLDTP